MPNVSQEARYQRVPGELRSLRRWKIPRHTRLAINTSVVESLNQGSADSVHTSMATAFRHEAAARAQGAMDTLDHHVRALNPVKYSVAEDSVDSSRYGSSSPFIT